MGAGEAETITAAELASRMGISEAELHRQVSESDRRAPVGPNRATRRALAKQQRRKGSR
jgi:hypothetical protein